MAAGIAALAAGLRKTAAAVVASAAADAAAGMGDGIVPGTAVPETFAAAALTVAEGVAAVDAAVPVAAHRVVAVAEMEKMVAHRLLKLLPFLWTSCMWRPTCCSSPVMVLSTTFRLRLCCHHSSRHPCSRYRGPSQHSPDSSVAAAASAPFVLVAIQFGHGRRCSPHCCKRQTGNLRKSWS